VRKVKALAASHAGIPEVQVRLPLIVMTSDATRDETVAFWRKHAFFGLPEAQLVFFEQGMNPCLTMEAKLMLAAPGELAMAPNGNGGCYAGLQQSGTLDRLTREGVRGIFQFGVDNLLCHVADPTFVGFCASREADCASKTVPKLHAHEPVGVVALADGAPKVVEYSEISREMAEAVNAKDGRLLYGSAHICVNYFSMAFLRRFIANDLATMPLHVAKKKIPTISADGVPVSPTENNGVKLELFIFDNFPKAQRMQVLQVPRNDEFAPIKNKPGAASDSPNTARELLYALNRRRLLTAGATIGPPPADHQQGAAIEISPLVSYQGEGLIKLVKGKELQLPLHM